MVRSGYRGLSLHRGALLGSAVLIVVLASRLPFLTPGYGNDPDGWLVVRTARYIAAHHQYRASRLPGFPVTEFAYALVSRAGPRVINGLTALMSVAAVGIFMRTLGRLGCRDWALAGLALAMTPVIFMSSTTSMDYLWGLALTLAATDSALAGRPLIAGVLLGLATGCRITSGAMLLPLAYLLYMRPALPARHQPSSKPQTPEPLVRESLVRESLLAPPRAGIPSRAQSPQPALAKFLIAALLIGAVCYAPAFARYGPAFFDFAEGPRPSAIVALYRATLRVWGLLGGATLVAAAATLLVRRRRRNPSLPRAGLARPTILASALTVVLYVAAYARHPAKAEYLIPAIPFVILLMAAVLDRREFRIACAGLCLSSFVAGVGSAATPPAVFSPHVWTRAIAGQPVSVDVLRGPVLLAHAERKHRDASIRRLLGTAQSLPPDSVVMVGYWLHEIELTRPDTPPNAQFVYTIDRDTFNQLVSTRRPVYYVPEMADFNRETTGLDLRSSGARPLRSVDQ